MNRLRHRASIGACLATSLALVVGGCTIVRRTVAVPEKAVGAVMPGKKAVGIDPADLQQRVLRLTDEAASRTGRALDEYGQRMGTREAATEALKWKINVVSGLMGIATGPNPTANLVDLVSVITLMRLALESDFVKRTNGAAFEPWLEANRTVETEAWQVAAQILTPVQQQELRDAIEKWHGQNPQLRTSFFARPQELGPLVRSSAGVASDSSSVFAFIGLDPMAGLDPAVREVTQTRLFAERAMFTLQRMPTLVRWQAELLSNEVGGSPEVRSVLTNAAALAESADRISRTAAQLPDRVSAERKEILAALDAQEGKLRELAVEVSRTLAAGESMSTSLNTTVTTFDGLMKRFGVGEPRTNAVRTTNSAPFNVLDYARTADQLTGMARELDALIKDFGSTLDSPAWEKRLQDFNAVSRQTQAEARALVNFITLRALLLVGAALVAAVIYKLISRRLDRKRIG